MNVTLAKFDDLVKSLFDENKSMDTRISLNSNNVIAEGTADVGRKQRKITFLSGYVTTSQFDQNNAVRNKLVAALKDQFDGQIPASVLKAFKGSALFAGSGDMKGWDKEGGVTSGRPLTLRRVAAIMDAVKLELSPMGKIFRASGFDPTERELTTFDKCIRDYRKKYGWHAGGHFTLARAICDALTDVDGIRCDYRIGKLLHVKTANGDWGLSQEEAVTKLAEYIKPLFPQEV